MPISRVGTSRRSIIASSASNEGHQTENTDKMPGEKAETTEQETVAIGATGDGSDSDDEEDP